MALLATSQGFLHFFPKATLLCDLPNAPWLSGGVRFRVEGLGCGGWGLKVGVGGGRVGGVEVGGLPRRHVRQGEVDLELEFSVQRSRV